MTAFLYIAITLFVIVCLFLILLVLIQKGRGGGLASAFGGGGGNTAFGTKTGDVLTWATSIVFGVFLLLGVAMNLISNNLNESRGGVKFCHIITALALPNSPKPRILTDPWLFSSNVQSA